MQFLQAIRYVKPRDGLCISTHLLEKWRYKQQRATPLRIAIPLIGANNDIQKTIERYHKHAKDSQIHNKGLQDDLQQLKCEISDNKNMLAILETMKRRLLGEGLSSCTTEELVNLENQLERSLSVIRKRKEQLIMEKIDQLKENERKLIEEQLALRETCMMQMQQSVEEREIVPYCQSSEDYEVETDLVIGRSQRRTNP
ncbi:MADS-box protein [Ranunculus cassubicifolius]